MVILFLVPIHCMQWHSCQDSPLRRHEWGMVLWWWFELVILGQVLSHTSCHRVIGFSTFASEELFVAWHGLLLTGFGQVEKGPVSQWFGSEFVAGTWHENWLHWFKAQVKPIAFCQHEVLSMFGPSVNVLRHCSRISHHDTYSFRSFQCWASFFLPSEASSCQNAFKVEVAWKCQRFRFFCYWIWHAELWCCASGTWLANFGGSPHWLRVRVDNTCLLWPWVQEVQHLSDWTILFATATQRLKSLRRFSNVQCHPPLLCQFQYPLARRVPVRMCTPGSGRHVRVGFRYALFNVRFFFHKLYFCIFFLDIKKCFTTMFFQHIYFEIRIYYMVIYINVKRMRARFRYTCARRVPVPSLNILKLHILQIIFFWITKNVL